MNVTDTIVIPEDELLFSFARAGGPGGQNVNKVSSKAILHWNLAANTTVPVDIKDRLRRHHAKRITTDGFLVIQGQRFRDQAKNIEDCREKLQQIIAESLHAPRPRKATRPTRGSKRRRLEAKRHQSERKAARRVPTDHPAG
jgi:ribosome-associated protein